MSRFVLLDSGPLGLLSHPRNSAEIDGWVRRIGRSGVIVTLPEITDYEVRRELLRARRQRGIHRLDVLKNTLFYAPLMSETMLKAAEYWSDARRAGRPTASPDALDVDVILAAQAWVLASRGHDVTVATENPGHLSLFTTTARWQEI
jgi:predicted nucleic acid-binding protein